MRAPADLYQDGYCVVENVIPTDFVDRMAEKLSIVVGQRKRFTLPSMERLNKALGHHGVEENGNEGRLTGSAHHVVISDDIFLEYLEKYSLVDCSKKFLEVDKVILNSFGGVENYRGDDNYSHGKSIHRDTRTYHRSFRQLLWMFVPLDDFTNENGATWVLPRSHGMSEPPSSSQFFDDGVQILARRGDVIMMDGRLWHAAGVNRTTNKRRLLTISFSPAFIKQQMDYCRAIGFEKVESLSESVKQLLGYYARTPASLDEWYLPPARQFYQSDQG